MVFAHCRPRSPSNNPGRTAAVRRAASVIELLVVIAILGALSALVLAGVQKSRAAAARLECADRMRNLSFAAASYASANNSTLPPGITLRHPRFKNQPYLSFLA